MAPNEIPGYYWDEKKRRYFKVEKGTTAPGDAAWSSDNVKKRKLEDAASVEALRKLNLNKNRIVRSEAVNQPIMGGFFARECGETDLDLPAAAFAQGFVEKGKVPLANTAWGSNTNVKHMFVAGKDHKNDICTVYASLDETVVLSTYIPRDPSSGRVHRRLISDHIDMPIHLRPNREISIPQISDIKYSEKAHRMLVASRYPSSQVSTMVFAPKRTGPDDTRPTWLIGDSGTTLYLNVRAYGDHAFNDYGANVVCPAPRGNEYMFLVGSSRGLLHCRGDMSMGWSSPWGPGHYYGPQDSFIDIFAVDFLPTHPKVVLFGGRPGYLFKGDLRQNASQWSKLDLNNAITHIKPINENQLLVSGIRNMLAVYDLRYTARFRGSFGLPAGPVTPLFKIDQYKNAAHIKIGLDVDLESGIAAAAHDDGKVALYSVRSGKRLPSRDIDKIQSRHGAIHCVQFEPFPGDRTPSLFVGEHGNINTYTFGVDNPEDEA
ncbi:Mitochondrial DNA replication protein yhm2 [Hypoxylon texense]